jgi:hypothetical protein
MLETISCMPEYQWKLTIVERNLLLSNWVKLMPEAQEQMLWEAEDLIEDVTLPDRQRLLTSLETLQENVEENLQQKIQQILSNQLNLDIRQALEFNIQNTTQSTDGLEVNSSALMESIS